MAIPTCLDFDFLARHPGIASAMDFAGSVLHVFEDGTAMLWDVENPEFTYSPRLPVEDLEVFCVENNERYVGFFDANEHAIENGESVKMEHWWLTDAMSD